MSWWGSNWNPDRTTRQQAGQDFLRTGNINTAFGGSACRTSADCASGYVCAGGRCVLKPTQEGVGSGAGCGEGEGGGGCNSQVTVSNGGDNTGWYLQPTYSADGCTVTGCSLAACGGGFSDCPGERSCRYDAFGTVNCFCGPPVYTGCSEFCTEYSKTFGEEAAGCSGLVCDECSYCDEIFVSASGTCKEIPGSWGDNLVPCHCDKILPECTKCDENGQRVLDEENCGPCVTLFEDCICGVTVEANCCYTLAELDGGSAYAKCQQAALKECEKQCPDTKPDPCLGVCTDKIECNGPVPEDTAWLQNTVTGVITAGGQTCYLYTQCNIASIPEDCFVCDCNCNDDCGVCETCGPDGECIPDPDNCSLTTKWEIYIPPTTIYLPPLLAACNERPFNISPATLLETTACGPYPHKLVMTQSYDLQTTTETGECGTELIRMVKNQRPIWDIVDANGVVIGSISGATPIPGVPEFSTGIYDSKTQPLPIITPVIIQTTPC